jgi:hypothetical protein
LDAISPNVIYFSLGKREEGSSGSSAAGLLSTFRPITERKVESNLPECVHFYLVLAGPEGGEAPGHLYPTLQEFA